MASGVFGLSAMLRPRVHVMRQGGSWQLRRRGAAVRGLGGCFGSPGLRHFEGWNAMLRCFTARGGQLDGIRRNESLLKKCSILK